MPSILQIRFLAAFICFFLIPAPALAKKFCDVPEFTKEEIHEILKKERKARDDLPPAYSKYKYKVTKEGCYYHYFEQEVSNALHHDRTFKLNRFGKIIEVFTGPAWPVKIKCPGKLLSQKELGNIIKKARHYHPDLPPPFPNSRIQTSRRNCLQIYLEVELPEDSRTYLSFTVDPFGELMEFSFSKSRGLESTPSTDPSCGTPELSADQIFEIIKQERNMRDDLPPAHSNIQRRVETKGCYYIYTEDNIPLTEDSNLIFKLNRRGSIVEVRRDTYKTLEINCPEKKLVEAELKKIVQKERGTRQDLESPFSNYKISLAEFRCQHIFEEVEFHTDTNNSQMFLIDQYGGLMFYQFRQRGIIKSPPQTGSN